jgi:hypothetical protein
MIILKTNGREVKEKTGILKYRVGRKNIHFFPENAVNHESGRAAVRDPERRSRR